MQKGRAVGDGAGILSKYFTSVGSAGRKSFADILCPSLSESEDRGIFMDLCKVLYAGDSDGFSTADA